MQKRIMLTHIVARAVKKIEKEKPDLVAKSFVNCSISISPDGSEIERVRLKGIDWRSIDWTGWEEASNAEAIKSKEVGPEEEDAINELTINYDSRNIPVLKAYYRRRGITGYSKMRKPELVEALRKADEEDEVEAGGVTDQIDLTLED